MQQIARDKTAEQIESGIRGLRVGEAPYKPSPIWGDMPEKAAREIVEGLYEGGIELVCYLAESEFSTAEKLIGRDERFQVISVSQESAGVAIAAAATMAGKKSAMLLGASGFPLTAYPLCWLGMGGRMPVLLLITTRTFGEQAERYQHPTALIDPFLQALGVPVRRVTRTREVRKVIANCARNLYGWWKPIAVVLCEEVIDGRGEPWDTPLEGS